MWRIPKSNFDDAIKKGQIIIYINEFHYRGPTYYNIPNMIMYEIKEKIMPIYKEWTNRKNWSKEEIVIEAKRKFQIYVDNKGNDNKEN